MIYFLVSVLVAQAGPHLNRAIAYRDVDRAEVALSKKGESVHGDPGDFSPPLHRCALKGSVWITKLLLDKGADVNQRDSQGRTALMLAAEFDQRKVFHHLLQHGAQTGLRDKARMSALDYAYLKTNNHGRQLAKMLLNRRAENADLPVKDKELPSDPDAVFRLALERDDPALVDHLFRSTPFHKGTQIDGVPILFEAAKLQAPQVFLRLLQKGCDPFEKFWNLDVVQWAIETNDYPVPVFIRFLLSLPELSGHQGWMSAQKENVAPVLHLFRTQVDLDVGLFSVIKSSDIRWMRYFLNNGADPTIGIKAALQFRKFKLVYSFLGRKNLQPEFGLLGAIAVDDMNWIHYFLEKKKVSLAAALQLAVSFNDSILVYKILMHGVFPRSLGLEAAVRLGEPNLIEWYRAQVEEEKKSPGQLLPVSIVRPSSAPPSL